MRGLLIIIMTLFSALTANGATDLQKVLKDLDYHLKNGETYTHTKTDKISQLREKLQGASCEESYELNYALFKEFQSFKYDSAYFYANQCLELAAKLDDNDKKVRSRCALVFCYLSSGLFLEAFNELQKINANDVSNDIKVEYYSICNRLYYDASDFNDTEKWSTEYTRIGTLYADSLMAIVHKDSYEYLFARAQREIKHWHYEQCIDLYKELLTKHKVSDHDKAIIHSSIGGAYKALKQNDSSMVYLAKAAIYDIISATKETTALYRLAEMLCEANDAERAYTYIHSALEDADFYNARHRKLSINPILPIIEKTRFEDITKQRNQMAIISVLCILMIITLTAAFILFKKQHKKLKKKSHQLTEANKIKEEYIGHSFYINSENISEIEELYKTINQKITVRQYEDLRDLTKQAKINKKRESMYESFDKCFLKIFPLFVQEYAKLFPEGHIDPNATSLTPEMRIFALIRLGINDSEKIAKFLNYSVHTIYTYKTRVKTKSIVSNEEFTKRIKSVEIGS